MQPIKLFEFFLFLFKWNASTWQILNSSKNQGVTVHEPCVLQASVHHLYRMRKGRWLSAGVSEINLRNPALNHTTRGCLHNPLHFTIWPSGTWTTMGKTWTIQVSRLKVSVRPSGKKTRHTLEMITMLRTWAVTKVSRHKDVLSWTKTIWAMVRSMREMRHNMRRSARRSTIVRTRRKIKELITMWVSSIVKGPLLNSLTTEAKLIQVTSTTTKHANKIFLHRLGDFFTHFSLRVEGLLWTG
jgi:hypothetical protein